jgi:hypothetical protein
MPDKPGVNAAMIGRIAIAAGTHVPESRARAVHFDSWLRRSHTCPQNQENVTTTSSDLLKGVSIWFAVRIQAANQMGTL